MDSEYFNNLIRDLWLTKPKSEKLINSLSQLGFVNRNVDTKRGEFFHDFYSNEENFVYCNNVTGLVTLLTGDYNPKNWFLFLDTSESSLKACICHSSFPEIPILFQPIFNDHKFDIFLCLSKLNYNNHNWYIFGDLKSITFFVGLKSPSDELCYACDFNRLGSKIKFGANYNNRLNFEKIALHPTIIKIDLMKQFIKKLVERNESAFHYLVNLFNDLSPEKIKKAKHFDITHLNRLIDNSESFDQHLSRNEKAAWESLKNVSNNLFENFENQQFYYQDIKELFENFDEIGCTMSSSLHFLEKHLHIYSKFDFDFTNLQCNRFHRLVNFIEKMYNPNWNREIICDYIWCTIKESDEYGSIQRNSNILPRRFFRLNFNQI